MQHTISFAKLQPNEHGLRVSTYSLDRWVEYLRRAGYEIEAVSYPLTLSTIIIWFYPSRSTPAALPVNAFPATLAREERIIHAPKVYQKQRIVQLQQKGYKILAVDYDESVGRIWFV
uniref:Uncharacterized protein n=1 Tax=Marseillevirus LCMAC202 TaxID=2506606 RepID=A0A481YZJ0_9VIRU|nr:MAG: hypothetical protein LCMAC202_02370 [Marseillevirus LCMAC202]